MEGFIYSLILGAISVLAFIAYRHHTAFSKIGPLLYLISVITYSGMLFWNLAITIAGARAQLAVGYQEAEKIRQAIDGLQIPFGVLFIAFFLWMGYLTVLWFLPDILHLDHGDTANDKH